MGTTKRIYEVSGGCTHKGDSHLLVSFFSRNLGGALTGKLGETWRKSSPSGTVWVAGVPYWLPY